VRAAHGEAKLFAILRLTTTGAGKKREGIGRQVGERPSDKHVNKVLELHKHGLSYVL
jgi:hypothetical protein